MKATVREDGRTTLKCPKCGKEFHPHIPFPRKPKLVTCEFCNFKYVVQGQFRNGKLCWIRRPDLEFNLRMF